MSDDDAKQRAAGNVLNSYFAEIANESDRGLALIGAAIIDEKLAKCLQAFFARPTPNLTNGANAPLGSFSSRIEMCSALALIDDFEAHECRYVRKIRNEFAHDVLTTSFAKRNIADLALNFKSSLPDEAERPRASPRFLFQNAIVTLAISFLYRPEYVAIEARKPKQWVDREQMRWRVIADEPPPKDTPVIFFGRTSKTPPEQGP